MSKQEIPIQCFSVGPVRISPDLREQILNTTVLAIKHGERYFGELLRLASPTAPYVLDFKRHREDTEVKITFVDHRLGPGIPYSESLRKLVRGEAVTESAAMTAGTKFTDGRTVLDIRVNTTPLYKWRPTPQPRFSPFSRARLPDSLFHEVNHTIHARLFEILARSGGIDPHWSHFWTTPTMLEEGHADIEAFAEPVTITTSEGCRAVTFWPGMKMMAEYVIGRERFKDETTPGEEIYNPNLPYIRHLDTKNADFLWFNRAKCFLSFLCLISIRAGLSPIHLLGTLTESNTLKISFDGSTIHLTDVANGLIGAEIGYPFFLRKEAMLVMVEAMLYYLQNYGQFAQTAKCLSNSLKSDDMNRVGAVQMVNNLNTHLLRHLVGDIRDLTRYSEAFLELVHNSGVVQSFVKSIPPGRLTQNRQPISVFSRAEENPRLAIIEWLNNKPR